MSFAQTKYSFVIEKKKKAPSASHIEESISALFQKVSKFDHPAEELIKITEEEYLTSYKNLKKYNRLIEKMNLAKKGSQQFSRQAHRLWFITSRAILQLESELDSKTLVDKVKILKIAIMNIIRLNLSFTDKPWALVRTVLLHSHCGAQETKGGEGMLSSSIFYQAAKCFASTVTDKQQPPPLERLQSDYMIELVFPYIALWDPCSHYIRKIFSEVGGFSQRDYLYFLLACLDFMEASPQLNESSKKFLSNAFQLSSKCPHFSYGKNRHKIITALIFHQSLFEFPLKGKPHPLDTSDGKSIHTKSQGITIFSGTISNGFLELSICKSGHASEPGRLHHSTAAQSSFFVFCCGEIGVQQGQLRFLSNDSGHYKPGLTSFYVLLKHLHNTQVDLSNCLIKVYLANNGHLLFTHANAFIEDYEQVLDNNGKRQFRCYQQIESAAAYEGSHFETELVANHMTGSFKERMNGLILNGTFQYDIDREDIGEINVEYFQHYPYEIISEGDSSYDYSM